MFLTTEYVILSVLGGALIALTRLPSFWLWSLQCFKAFGFIPFKFQQNDNAAHEKSQDKIKDIMALAECHETAAHLADLIQKDGAGSWPPRANHAYSTWPVALRPYGEIYQEMAPLLPATKASLDDEVNKERINAFRSHFRELLKDRVNLQEVTELLEAADTGRWDVFPRDAYNSFYCCIAWGRHAYR